jgi:hypothetical protein
MPGMKRPPAAGTSGSRIEPKLTDLAHRANQKRMP